MIYSTKQDDELDFILFKRYGNDVNLTDIYILNPHLRGMSNTLNAGVNIHLPEQAKTQQQAKRSLWSAYAEN